MTLVLNQELKKAQFTKQKSAALSNYKNFGNTQREVASPN